MTSAPHKPLLGIFFMSIGMLAISVNDMLVKALSGDYPLHQIVFARSGLGIFLAFAILQFEGGFRAMKVSQPGLHVLRGCLIVVANLSFYAAIVAIPLATATAIYFVAPLFVTLLAIPVLGEHVGPRRIAAVSVGFVGVLIILWPELAGAGSYGALALLPVLAAAGYASMSVLTRKLSAAPASVLSVWVQVAFILSSGVFWVVTGEGQLLEEGQSESLQFLLRPWVWPDPGDLWIFGLLGVLAGTVGYSMAQAYRLAPASSVAPFEYLLMLYALFWGWSIFGEWPRPGVFLGAAVIVGAGAYIVWREREKKAALPKA